MKTLHVTLRYSVAIPRYSVAKKDLKWLQWSVAVPSCQVAAPRRLVVLLAAHDRDTHVGGPWSDLARGVAGWIPTLNCSWVFGHHLSDKMAEIVCLFAGLII